MVPVHDRIAVTVVTAGDSVRVRVHLEPLGVIVLSKAVGLGFEM